MPSSTVFCRKLPRLAPLVLLAMSSCMQAQTANPALPGTATTSNERGAPLARHVLIVSIDGCRPDVLLRSNAPHLRALMARGSFSFYAETTDIAITLPSHTSMLTGVTPYVHGIFWNSDEPPVDGPRHPAVPTIFELAKRRGLSTAIAAGKKKFEALNRPGAVDFDQIFTGAKMDDDVLVAQQAADLIKEHQPNLLFLHLANTDIVGHAIGWGTPEQIAAIEAADRGIGIVVDAIDKAHLTDDTLIIVSADHGGSGKKHGYGDQRSHFIPWIVAGPGIRRGYDLTRDRDHTIHTEDTFATACYFLGIPLPKNVSGKPVTDALQRKDSSVAPAP